MNNVTVNAIFTLFKVKSVKLGLDGGLSVDGNLRNYNIGFFSTHNALKELDSEVLEVDVIQIDGFDGHERVLTVKVHPWEDVQSFKLRLLNKLNLQKSIRPADLRLLLRGMDLPNTRKLNELGIFDSNIPIRPGLAPTRPILQYSFRRPDSQVTCGIRVIKGVDMSYEPSMIRMMEAVQGGFNSGLVPQRTELGTGGSYFLKTPVSGRAEVVAVFKPRDEEGLCPANPKGFTGNFGQAGFREGILAGEGCSREVAAYLLDQTGGRLAGVPITALVESCHSSFSNANFAGGSTGGGSNHLASSTQQHGLVWKEGALQCFVPSYSSAEEFVENSQTTSFGIEDVHRLALFDLRTGNGDRNDGNILIQDRTKPAPAFDGRIFTFESPPEIFDRKRTYPPGKWRLIPIDHGLILPDCIKMTDLDVVWFTWRQLNYPMSPLTLKLIESLDYERDSQRLGRKLVIRQDALRTLKAMTLLLKVCASLNLNLRMIADIAYRPLIDQPSPFEVLIKKAIVASSFSFCLRTGGDSGAANGSAGDLVVSSSKKQRMSARIIERKMRGLPAHSLIQTNNNNNNNNNNVNSAVNNNKQISSSSSSSVQAFSPIEENNKDATNVSSILHTSPNMNNIMDGVSPSHPGNSQHHQAATQLSNNLSKSSENNSDMKMSSTIQSTTAVSTSQTSNIKASNFHQVDNNNDNNNNSNKHATALRNDFPPGENSHASSEDLKKSHSSIWRLQRALNGCGIDSDSSSSSHNGSNDAQQFVNAAKLFDSSSESESSSSALSKQHHHVSHHADASSHSFSSSLSSQFKKMHHQPTGESLFPSQLVKHSNSATPPAFNSSSLTVEVGAVGQPNNMNLGLESNSYNNNSNVRVKAISSKMILGITGGKNTKKKSGSSSSDSSSNSSDDGYVRQSKFWGKKSDPLRIKRGVPVNSSSSSSSSSDNDDDDNEQFESNNMLPITTSPLVPSSVKDISKMSTNITSSSLLMSKAAAANNCTEQNFRLRRSDPSQSSPTLNPSPHQPPDLGSSWGFRGQLDNSPVEFGNEEFPTAVRTTTLNHPVVSPPISNNNNNNNNNFSNTAVVGLGRSSPTSETVNDSEWDPIGRLNVERGLNRLITNDSPNLQDSTKMNNQHDLEEDDEFEIDFPTARRMRGTAIRYRPDSFTNPNGTANSGGNDIAGNIGARASSLRKAAPKGYWWATDSNGIVHPTRGWSVGFEKEFLRVLSDEIKEFVLRNHPNWRSYPCFVSGMEKQPPPVYPIKKKTTEKQQKAALFGGGRQQRSFLYSDDEGGNDDDGDRINTSSSSRHRDRRRSSYHNKNKHNSNVGKKRTYSDSSSFSSSSSVSSYSDDDDSSDYDNRRRSRRGRRSRRRDSSSYSTYTSSTSNSDDNSNSQNHKRRRQRRNHSYSSSDSCSSSGTERRSNRRRERRRQRDYDSSSYTSSSETSYYSSSSSDDSLSSQPSKKGKRDTRRQKANNNSSDDSTYSQTDADSSSLAKSGNKNKKQNDIPSKTRNHDRLNSSSSTKRNPQQKTISSKKNPKQKNYGSNNNTKKLNQKSSEQIVKRKEKVKYRSTSSSSSDDDDSEDSVLISPNRNNER